MIQFRLASRTVSSSEVDYVSILTLLPLRVSTELPPLAEYSEAIEGVVLRV
jgi:hypothetical protein